MLNYYQILGVDPSDTFETIRIAFHKKAMACHPDRGGSHEQMVILNEAWEILSDPDIRRKYDAVSAGSANAEQTTSVGATVQAASQRAHDYPRSWSDFEGWLNMLEKDVLRAEYGSERVYREFKIPTAGKSASGWIFILAGALLVGVFGCPLASRFLDSIATSLPNSADSLLGGLLSMMGGVFWLSLLISPVLIGAWGGATAHKAIRDAVFWNGKRRDASRAASADSSNSSVNRSSDQRARWAKNFSRHINGLERCFLRIVALLKSLKFLRNARFWSTFVPFALMLFLISRCVFHGNQPLPGTNDLSDQATSDSAPAFTREQMAIGAQMIEVRWTVWRPGKQTLFGWTDSGDAIGAVSGSSGVIRDEKQHELFLFTNRHVLDFGQIIQSRLNDGLAIKKYEISVKFPTGKVCPVLAIGYESTGLDLVELEVDSRSLTRGVDYAVLPVVKASTNPQIGDPVVAVGNPGIGDSVFENTETFGRISSFREFGPPATSMIQIDAALNHGNSGGPLFLELGSKYYWLGINTSGAGRDEGMQGINFAIDARQANSAKFLWYPADLNGISKALTELFNCTTGVFR